MIKPIASPTLEAAAPAEAAKAKPKADAAPDADRAKLEKAALEFEAVLVRRLLASTNLEKSGGSTYGSMCVDAVTQGIQGAGGLGLADQISSWLDAKAPEKGTRE